MNKPLAKHWSLQTHSLGTASALGRATVGVLGRLGASARGPAARLVVAGLDGGAGGVVGGLHREYSLAYMNRHRCTID
jgi:hypothetical protein